MAPPVAVKLGGATGPRPIDAQVLAVKLHFINVTMWPEIGADLRRKSPKPAHSGRAFLNQIAIDERLRGGGSSNGA